MQVNNNFFADQRNLKHEDKLEYFLPNKNLINWLCEFRLSWKWLWRRALSSWIITFRRKVLSPFSWSKNRPRKTTSKAGSWAVLLFICFLSWRFYHENGSSTLHRKVANLYQTTRCHVAEVSIFLAVELRICEWGLRSNSRTLLPSIRTVV
jgi:hypothetical protein